ncbi:MAG: PH domain-containing protein [Gammaproteobacteria bacterium]
MSDVLYQSNPPMFRNNPFGFVISVLLIPVFGIGILILLVWYISTKAQSLTVTSQDLLYEKGILSKSRSELRLTSIRSVRVHQTLFQRMFGTGDIEIFTAGDTPEVTAKGMPDPNKVRELVGEHS